MTLPAAVPYDSSSQPDASVIPTAYRGHMQHYANCFCLLSQKCFRMIQASDGTGHA